MDDSQSPYHAIGGEKVVKQLVVKFYEKVKQHPDLAPIFPADLTETTRKQEQFLTQFLGGPPLFSNEHGHPMLRARHLPFKITPTRAEAWISCMRETLSEININEDLREFILHRLTQTAYHMVNSDKNK